MFCFRVQGLKENNHITIYNNKKYINLKSKFLTINLRERHWSQTDHLIVFPQTSVICGCCCFLSCLQKKSTELEYNNCTSPYAPAIIHSAALETQKLLHQCQLIYDKVSIQVNSSSFRKEILCW